MKAEKFIRDYLGRYTRCKEYWNYEDGCVLEGAAQMYGASGDAFYLDFMKGYMEYFVREDGSFDHFHPNRYNLDSMKGGRADRKSVV